MRPIQLNAGNSSYPAVIIAGLGLVVALGSAAPAAAGDDILASLEGNQSSAEVTEPVAEREADNASRFGHAPSTETDAAKRSDETSSESSRFGFVEEEPKVSAAAIDDKRPASVQPSQRQFDVSTYFDDDLRAESVALPNQPQFQRPENVERSPSAGRVSRGRCICLHVDITDLGGDDSDDQDRVSKVARPPQIGP